MFLERHLMGEFQTDNLISGFRMSSFDMNANVQSMKKPFSGHWSPVNLIFSSLCQVSP